MSLAPGSSKRLALLGAGAILVGVGLRLRPLSVWLVPFSADGQLQTETARFLDRAWVLPLALGAVLVAAAWSSSLRRALSEGWRGEPAPRQGRSWVVPLALLTLLARFLVGAWSDVGLGDDGARVAWLLWWLQDPVLLPAELWAPGYLYLHALVWLVVRDAVWAGIALGSLASAGTVWLLGGMVQRTWGRSAGNLSALLVGALPVASAHGATPDVNPVFACLCVGALACSVRARAGGMAWLWAAWTCVFFAAWSRFETLFLVPAFALPLWPHWRRTGLFAAACMLPTLLWMAALEHAHGDFLHVFRTLRVDPTLIRPLASQLFDFAWAAWLAMPLPILVVGALGGAVALRARRCWELVPLLVLHVASLLAATWSTGAGNQPRHLILAGALLAAAAGIFLAGMMRSSRRWGGIALGSTLLLVPLVTGLFAPPGELWIRRNSRLRGVVDCVAAERRGAGLNGVPLVWIADEAGYFFLCRHRPPAHLYHAMPRADSDPETIALALRDAAQFLVCVRGNEEAERRWAALRAAVAAEFEVVPLAARCRTYELFRLAAFDAAGKAGPGPLASGATAWFPRHPSPDCLGRESGACEAP